MFNQKLDENYLISPHAIATSLFICFRGANGDTLRHLKRVLYLDKKKISLSTENVERDRSKNRDQENERLSILETKENLFIIETINELIKYTTQKLGVKMDDKCKISNSRSDFLDKDGKLLQTNILCTSSQFKASDAFVSSIKNDLNGKYESIDFTNKRQSANKINDHLKETIPSDMIQINDINENMSGLILDATFFKANFMHEFSLLKEKCPFTTQRGDQVDVDMFTTTDLVNIYIDPKGITGTLCQIPFKGDNVVMSIILPKRNTPISTIICEISDPKENLFRNTIRKSNQKLVKITMPKIKFESDTIEV